MEELKTLSCPSDSSRLGLNPNSKVSGNFDVDENLEKLEAALTEAENILNLALSQEMQVGAGILDAAFPVVAYLSL